MSAQLSTTDKSVEQASAWLDYIAPYVDRQALLLRLRSIYSEMQATFKAAHKTQEANLLEVADKLAEFAKFGLAYFVFLRDQQGVNLNSVVQKIEYELNTIRPLVQQRQRIARRAKRPQGGQAPLSFDDLLVACDLIASSCIRRSVDDQATDKFCLTMFQDATHMRQGRLAYPRVASVSLPQTAWSEPWLWLGIAHEIGHFWYWNYEVKRGQSYNRFDGKQSRGADQSSEKRDRRNILKEQLEKDVIDHLGSRTKEYITGLPLLQKELIKPADYATPVTNWLAWLEELFADIFGAVLIGPAYIQSLMYVLARDLANGQLLANDGHHPPAILRPLTQIRALEHFPDGARLVDSWPSLLPSDGLFDIPKLEQFWQRRCEVATGRSYDELLSDKLGGLPLRTYVDEFVPLAVEIVVNLIKQSRIQPYTLDDHTRICTLARALAAGDPPDPQATANLPPAFALPVAWYAWREITQEWVKKDGENKPLFPGHDLAKPTQRAKRLNAIRRWLGQLQQPQPELENSTPIATQWPIHQDMLEKVADAAEWSTLNLTSSDFDDLLVELQDSFPNDEQAKVDYLLAIEFSVQHQEWVWYTDPQTGQVVKLWHSTVSDPEP